MKRLLLIGLMSASVVMAMEKELVVNVNTIQEVLKLVLGEQKRLEWQVAQLKAEQAREVLSAACWQAFEVKIAAVECEIQNKVNQANKLINKVGELKLKAE